MELILQLIVAVCLMADWIDHSYTRSRFQVDASPYIDRQSNRLLKRRSINEKSVGSTISDLSTNNQATNLFDDYQSNSLRQLMDVIYSSVRSPAPLHYNRPKIDSFLFSCTGLSEGFYADVYNDCSQFFLCHKPNLKFNPLKQLAITSYLCPSSTYFNQKRLTCTHLEDFEMTCSEQIKLFQFDISNAELEHKRTHALSDVKHDEKLRDPIEKQLEKPNLNEISDEKSTNVPSTNDEMMINESVFNKLQDNRLISEKREFLDELNELSLDKLMKSNEQDKILPTNKTLLSNSNIIEPITNRTENEVLDESGLDKLMMQDAAKDVKEPEEIIETTFSCDRRSHGYYVDISNRCSIFHVCQPIDESYQQQNHETSTHFMSTFRCPNNLMFNQVTLTCTREEDLIVACEAQEVFFAKLQPILNKSNITQDNRQNESTEKSEEKEPENNKSAEKELDNNRSGETKNSSKESVFETRNPISNYSNLNSTLDNLSKETVTTESSLEDEILTVSSLEIQ